MNIDTLRFFYDVATYKSISKAASLSHISQSALSQQLSNMENRFGAKFFERSNKGVELTPQGRTLLKYVEVILQSYDRMLEEMDSFKQNKSIVVIDSYYNLSNSSITTVLYNSKKRFPDLDIRLNNTIIENIESNITNNISDLGISFREPDDNSLLFTKIMEDSLVLVASKNFNGPDSISIGNIADYPLIMINDRFNVKRKLQLALKDMGSSSDLNILYTVNTMDMARDSVLKGYGLSVIPRICIMDDLIKGKLKEVTLKDFSLDYNIYLIYTNSNYKLMKPFIDYVKKECKKIYNII